jgi:hypothetical protein
MTILIVVQAWRAYLQFQEFVILTDQRSLTQLAEQQLHTQWQQKVFTKLLGLQYRIVYRKGTDNRAADALSRCPASSDSCVALTTLIPSWLSLITVSYEGDSFVQQMIAKLSLDSTVAPNYTLQSGILRYKNRIWVGTASDIQHRLIAAFHESAWGGHSGVPVTLMRLK